MLYSLVLATFCFSSISFADTFGSGANIFTIDFVKIGDPGNPDDTGTTGLYHTVAGGVDYEYRIGKYEISTGMVHKANNLGGLEVIPFPYALDEPAGHVTWNEAARFVNWLNTSQGHQAAYRFAVNPGDPGYSVSNANDHIQLWDSSDSWQEGGENRFRHRDAYYFLPSFDEYYKAAYYSGSGNIYYDFPTGQDANQNTPKAVAFGTEMGTSVYGLEVVSGAPAPINQAGGLSAYGTMAQGGNINEHVESTIFMVNNDPMATRRLMGGEWSGVLTQQRSSFGGGVSPNVTSFNDGFRVASVIPEPSSLSLLLAVGGLGLWRRRRSA